MILEGNNLDILNKLLKEGYKGRIDMIYIDPPYFTNEDQGDYDDSWENMESYLEMLRPRLVLMKELLSDEGVIVVHLDWHSVHYVKIELDKIFGYKNFINELIWCYKSGGASKRFFARKHDNILVYSKTKDYIFNPQKEKSYNRGGKPYRFKGVEEFQDEKGQWYTLVNHKDVINMDMVGRTSKERTGYATQKPEKLLELLISSFTKDGALVADFFAGSGSFGAAAKNLGRDFILCDQNPDAVEIMRKRLENQ